MAKKQQKQDQNLETVQEAINTTEGFIEKNQKLLSWIVFGIVAIILVVLAVRQYYYLPKKAEAADKLALAEALFAQDNFEIALNGDDEADVMGFADIADEYGITPAGNLANAYAGICAYKLGNYEDAVAYLKAFDGEDINVRPAAKQLLGDAYIELGEIEKGIKEYEAVAKMNNKLISPMSLKKAGIAYESIENYKAARKAYQQIKDNYPQSSEASDIDKYIARIAEK